MSWLENLPEYPCIKCSDITIFKGLCLKCDLLEENRMLRAELAIEQVELIKSITSLREELSKNKVNLQLTEEWLKTNDKEFEK